MLITPTVQTYPLELTKKVRIGIIRSSYHSELTLNLEEACRETLRDAGVPEKNIQTHTVPGSLEIPVVAELLASSHQVDVLIAFGIVIKGDTYHFELVVNECSRGCMEVSLRHQIPIIMEVLASYTLDQANERASKNGKNKGIEAANAALHTYQTLCSIKSATHD